MASDMQWSVRPLVCADEPSWRALYRGYRRFYEAPDDEAAIDVVWEWLNDDHHESEGYVAVDEGGRVAGLAHVRRFARPLSATTGLFLDDLFTDPALRGRGLGRALLKFLAVYATEQGLSVVRWITAEDNAPARSLYDSEATATTWVTYDMPPRDPG